MEKSFFFNAKTVDGAPDRVYTAADIAEREALLISDGVLGADSLQVFGLNGAGVYVGTGGAVIDGYTYLNTELLSLAVDSGDGVYPRIDSVVLRLDLEGRTVNAAVIKGEAAASPTAPEAEDTDSVKYLPLAQVYVAADAIAVTAEDVTDRRELAGFASMKDSLQLLLRDHIGEGAVLSGEEVAALRETLELIHTDGDGDTVLCCDGMYRSVPVARRVLAAEYREAGDFLFDASAFPSEGGVYDVEVLGGGGGGGAYNGTDSRGGGGGGGGYSFLSAVPLGERKYKVTVGSGGEGVPGGSGTEGGCSSFGGLRAEGGGGGGGGLLLYGGSGGGGLFSGENGGDGRASAAGTVSAASGMGGGSHLGEGTPSADTEGEAEGISATGMGAGGSGASSLVGTFGRAGGSGGCGYVAVYRYLVGGEEL